MTALIGTSELRAETSDRTDIRGLRDVRDPSMRPPLEESSGGHVHEDFVEPMLKHL